MAKGNILIAEDDPVLRNLYIKKFSVMGYAIRTAQDGEEAVMQINLQTPDVLVLDIHMPKIDGFQVLQMLPKDRRPFPVVLLSNFADEKTKARGIELGADGYLVKKDMTIKALVEMVERLMALKGQQPPA